MKGALVLLSFIFLVFSQTDLTLNGNTLSLGGRYTYRNVALTNGAKIVIPTFNGVDFVNTGNLELTITGDLTIDTTSGIFGRGAGWQPKLCSFGNGPFSNSGGRGGCAVFDSGGGGAHLGDGGFGTKDCPNSVCVFPRDEEEACDGDWVPASTTCSSFVNCRQYMGFPETIGIGWSHSVFNNTGGIGLGAAGGDKGCRDGDGRSGARGGAGGGRVFLNITGNANINGKINMDGYRGCSLENDSGGGGAGGTIIILANTINLGAVANVTASGGLGGDSVDKDLVENPECIGTQIGGVCDDCGGGGGGGIIYMNAPNGNFYDPQRVYDRVLRVDGSKGGACLGCNYEARGQDGRISYGHRYEYCDGLDNTFDGEIDENQPLLQPCGLPSCVNGVPVYSCPNPTTAVPTTAAPTTAVPTTAVPTTAVSTTGASTVIPTSANVATTDTNVAGTSNAVSGSDNGASTDWTQGSQGSQSNGSQGSGSNGPVGTSENPEGSASALYSSMFVFGLLVLYL